MKKVLILICLFASFSACVKHRYSQLDQKKVTAYLELSASTVATNTAPIKIVRFVVVAKSSKPIEDWYADAHKIVEDTLILSTEGQCQYYYKDSIHSHK